MVEVRAAKPIGKYRIHLVFNNGKEGTANLEETIFNDKRSVFSKLKDESTFQTFKVDHGSVVWSDDLDLASEYLFYLAFKDVPDLQEQFRVWGYEGKEGSAREIK